MVAGGADGGDPGGLGWLLVAVGERRQAVNYSSPEAARAVLVDSLKRASRHADTALECLRRGDDKGADACMNAFCEAAELAEDAAANLARLGEAGAAPNLDLFRATQEPLL